MLEANYNSESEIPSDYRAFYERTGGVFKLRTPESYRSDVLKISAAVREAAVKQNMQNHGWPLIR